MLMCCNALFSRVLRTINIPTQCLAELRRKEPRRLIDTLVSTGLPWSGDEGYKKAEVTGGGVSFAEVDPRTMESRRHPGLSSVGRCSTHSAPLAATTFIGLDRPAAP